MHYTSAYDLSSGKAYVWHHKDGDIREDISKGADEDVFFTCITGDYNFKGTEMESISMYPRSIWIDTDTDVLIPTVTSSDRLIYVSKTEVPEAIIFERFADYGYTIGVSNMIKDTGGHCISGTYNENVLSFAGGLSKVIDNPVQITINRQTTAKQ